MSGSTVLNQRQHTGLQQLMLLGSLARTSLGPNKNYKFIQDEMSGESSLVCSCRRLLENIELSCAVGQLVSQTIQAHHKVYRSGSGCLLFIAGAWGHTALECLRRGLSVSHIISGMSEGMDICLDICTKNSISVEDLCPAVPKTHPAAVPGLQFCPPEKAVMGESPLPHHLCGTTWAVREACDNSGRRKVTHSRHFHEVESDRNVSKSVDISSVAKAVSHGCVDMMNLVVEASRIQSKIGVQEGSCTTFDISKLVTCVLPGSLEDSTCVLPGCVVLLSTEQASIACHLMGRRSQVALINGDLCDGYRHLGFSKPTAVAHVTNKLDSLLGQEEEWMENVLRTLSDLNVNLILVNGVADNKLVQGCFGRHVLVVEKVKPSILKAFANATGAVIVTYTTQLNRHCVGTGVHVSLWRDLSGSEREPSTAVNITTDNNTGLVTVILTSSVHGKMQAMEDRFWSCASRLHHALKDRALLPGAGWIEMLCIHHLQKRVAESGCSVQQTKESGRSVQQTKESGHSVQQTKEESGCTVQQTKAGGAGNPYRDVVLPLMADGLMDYVTTIMVNSTGCSKVEAWTAVSRQLKDLSRGLPTSAAFPNSGDEMEESVNSSDVKCSTMAWKKVCDNFKVKLEVWRRALDLVLLVLQTDAEIITGLDQTNVGAKAHVDSLL